MPSNPAFFRVQRGGGIGIDHAIDLGERHRLAQLLPWPRKPRGADVLGLVPFRAAGQELRADVPQLRGDLAMVAMDRLGHLAPGGHRLFAKENRYRLGKACTLADDIHTFDKVGSAKEAFARMKAHLADNHVEAANAKGFVGEVLKIDPKTEKFVGNSKANDMLFREYRKGFDITEAV